jgi:hypothetical protein
MQYPLLSLILEQDEHLREMWTHVSAFAFRCQEAYEQGQKAAESAFPSLPPCGLHLLHSEHLAMIEKTWHYIASEEASGTYLGYNPTSEHPILLRWFHRGYLSGAVSPMGISRPGQR